MIELYQFPPMYNLPNASPFCMKLESYLRAQNIDYKNHYSVDTRHSPTKKFPFMRENGKIYSDSGRIIERLEAESQAPMQARLTAREKAITLGFIRLCEEHLYWVLVYTRWVDLEGNNTWKEDLQKGAKVPGFIFKVIYKALQRTVLKQLDGQGLGRHEKEAIYLLAEQDLQALSDFLGERRYFFGDSATLLDHALYAVTSSIYHTPWDSRLKAIALQYENLNEHSKRMLSVFFTKGDDNQC